MKKILLPLPLMEAIDRALHSIFTKQAAAQFCSVIPKTYRALIMQRTNLRIRSSASLVGLRILGVFHRVTLVSVSASAARQWKYEVQLLTTVKCLRSCPVTVL